VHELSVCLSLLEMIQGIAAERGARQVTRIELGIGPLSGVESDLLRNAWPIAAAGSIAAEAELLIDAADIVVRCTRCKAETTATANKLICGECGDFRTSLVSGDEMTLLRVELADTR
jgi:hydrogenase nickel incorporation protein HypA/HybF